MDTLLEALVITDFPIIARTVTSVFRGQYQVNLLTWSTYVDRPVAQAEVVVVDVTDVHAEVALLLVCRSHPHAKIVVCSLDQNEVQVCRTAAGLLTVERRLPSLLAALSA